MALDERYFIESGLETVFKDKDTSLPLAGGTLEFYRDIARDEPKPVFRLAGPQNNYTYSSLGSVVTLNASGLVQDLTGNNVIIYYLPYIDTPTQTNLLDLYYVVCRNSAGVEQWTREAWPNVLASTDPTQATQSYDNQMSNPTFTNVFLNEGFDTVYQGVAGTPQAFECAPNWDFVIAGNGQVIVKRVPVSGSLEIPTSPPYILDVSVGTGVTSCLLRQRFKPNSGLWSSTDNRDLFLNGSVVIKNDTATEESIQMFYQDSGASAIQIFNEKFEGDYKLVIGSTVAAIPKSVNGGVGDDAFVDIYFQFTLGSHVQLSQAQVTPSIGEAVNFIPSDSSSANREQAYQGDYYIPEVIRNPVQSLLVGWDFHLNPRQFVGATTPVENVLTQTNAYILDQTIAQKTATGGLTVTREVDPTTGGMRFVKSATSGAFYVAQYMDAETAKKILSNRMSANVYGYQDSGASDVTVRVYLLVGTTIDDFPIIPLTLGTLSADGTFAVSAAGWEKVKRSGLPVAQANLSTVSVNSQINSTDNDYGFSGWEYPQVAPASQTLKNAAIVVTFASSGASNFVINSISLTPGNLPSRPPEKTKSQVLEECQYFYESSADGPQSTFTRDGMLVVQQAMAEIPVGGANNNNNVYPRTFQLKYLEEKRKQIPFVKLYSGAVPADVEKSILTSQLAAGADDVSTLIDMSATSPIFEQVLSSKKSITIRSKNSQTIMKMVSAPNSGTTGSPFRVQGYLQFHYIADARLGIIA